MSGEHTSIESETSAEASPAPEAIRIEGFSQRYNNFVAVDSLDVSIPKGTITGFIGPNGAGKTTTLHLLATLLIPTEGRAYIHGYNCVRQRSDVRRHMGYMPDTFGVYEGLTTAEYLDFFAKAHGLRSDKRKKLIDDVVELLNLHEKLQTPMEGLSRGQLQRLSLARTLLHDPEVLLLDEPASGLDPLARRELLFILRELRSLGKTLLVSSHILSEIAEVCDRLMIMARGQLIAYSTMKEILGGTRPHYDIEIELLNPAAVERARAFFRNEQIVIMQDAENSLEIRFVGGAAELANLHARLCREVEGILYFRPIEVTLEDAFAQLTSLGHLEAASGKPESEEAGAGPSQPIPHQAGSAESTESTPEADSVEATHQSAGTTEPDQPQKAAAPDRDS